MNIEQVIDLVSRVHDAERMNFGASSTREQRNEQWARLIGIVHWGHPTYNQTPDNQWHIKSAGNGRPQSDDVVVSMPSRQFWDCIPGSGANGYRFEAHTDGSALPSVQEVYAPPKPVGYVESGGGGNPNPNPNPTPQPTPEVLAAITQLRLQVEQLISMINALPSRECKFKEQEPQPQPQETEPGLKASIDALNDKLDRGLELEAKAGWPVGNIKGSARLRP